VLDAIEEVALVLVFALSRLELFLRQRPGEILDQLALLPSQLPRRLHLHGREQVAAAASVDVGHSFAAQAQRGPGLRAFVDLHRLGSLERRHLNLAAERDGREVDRNLAEQVVAVAPEELVLLHLDHDVQAAGRSAEDARFALAVEAQLLPRRDTRGNLDRELPLFRDASGAAARDARLGDDLAGAAALR